MKNIWIFLLTLMTSVLFSTALNAESRERIALLEFSANNTSKSYAKIVRNQIEVSLYKTNAFDIIEREKINLILKEQGFQMSGCTDTVCAVKIGKLLSVDYVIIGSINRMGQFIITVKFIDIHQGVVKLADSERAATEYEVHTAINSIAKRSAKKITGSIEGKIIAKGKEKVKEKAEPTRKPGVEEPPEPVELSMKTKYYLRSIVPGWGQFYAGKRTKGYVFLSSFIAAGAFMGYAIYDFNIKRGEYEDMKSETGSEFDEKHKASEDAAAIANISVLIFAAVYIANWVDVLLFSGLESENVSGYRNTTGFSKNCFSFNIYSSSGIVRESYYNMSFALRF